MYTQATSTSMQHNAYGTVSRRGIDSNRKKFKTDLQITREMCSLLCTFALQYIIWRISEKNCDQRTR